MQAALRMGRRGDPGYGVVAPPSAGGLQTNRRAKHPAHGSALGKRPLSVF